MIRVSESLRRWCVCTAVAAAIPSAASVQAQPIQAGAQPLLQSAPLPHPTPLPDSASLVRSAARAAHLIMTEPAPPPWRSSPLLRRTDEPRPRGLVPLYAGFGALQALDAHSTIRAVRAGRTESNPIVAPFADRPGMMIGVKAAAAAGTIAISERLWRRHRGAALTLMIVANVGYAAVVAHNYRQARR